MKLTLCSAVLVSGYDSYTSCSRPLRTSKSRASPPCDFRFQSWCTIPGSAYPWHAVRRFVHENQGLMRRMYGDQRQISLLRAEIESNDVENACPVKEEVVAPFWANNTRGEVLALLNLYPFEQYVHWEKCTFELKQMYCREGCRCEQQYRLHRLLAYDPNNECRGIFSDWFKFPSCCVCKCYDLPADFQITSRSPRTQPSGAAGENVYITPPDWYRLNNG
uniref:Spaetzle domain-containing protein n=1 Tax=Timema douglasi TaxID=61478 RepID=A0A7R8ZED0_TIMDO|nr:unnamed protein product [Timema douglasi]